MIGDAMNEQIEFKGKTYDLWQSTKLTKIREDHLGKFVKNKIGFNRLERFKELKEPIVSFDVYITHLAPLGGGAFVGMRFEMYYGIEKVRLSTLTPVAP
jgi:hypothetical protein